MTILTTSIHNGCLEEHSIVLGTENSFSCMMSEFSHVFSVFIFVEMCYFSDLISISLLR